LGQQNCALDLLSTLSALPICHCEMKFARHCDHQQMAGSISVKIEVEYRK